MFLPEATNFAKWFGWVGLAWDGQPIGRRIKRCGWLFFGFLLFRYRVEFVIMVVKQGGAKVPVLREVTGRKKRGKCGNFSQVGDPKFGNPMFVRKKDMVYFAF